MISCRFGILFLSSFEKIGVPLYVISNAPVAVWLWTTELIKKSDPMAIILLSCIHVNQSGVGTPIIENNRPPMKTKETPQICSSPAPVARA